MARAKAFGDSKGLPISLALRAGDFVYTSAVGDHGIKLDALKYDSNGVVIDDGAEMPDRDVEVETRATIETLRDLLGQAGCSLSDVIDISIWFRDARDFKVVNRVYGEYFTTAPYPTRSVFQVGFMGVYRVEMKAIAYKPLSAVETESAQSGRSPKK